MFRICCFLLCFVAGSRQLLITEFEVPDSIEVGSDVELRCLYNLNEGETEKLLFVKWWWTPADSEDRVQLYQRLAGHPPATTKHNIHTKIKENDTLVLLAVQPNSSGTYECEVSNIDEVRKHQKLIVYTKGTGPQLNVTTVPDGPDEGDEEDVLIVCRVENAAPLPDLALFIDQDEVNITETVAGPDINGFYNVLANVTVSKSSVNCFEVRCKLEYVNNNVTYAEFVDSLIYDPSGALTSTATPDDTTELDATVESNLPDDGISLRCSFELVLAASILIHLFGTLIRWDH